MRLLATTVFDEMAAVVHAEIQRRGYCQVSGDAGIHFPYVDFPASSQRDIDTAHIYEIDIAQI